MEASEPRPSHKDHPHTARGYFAACLGALFLGLGVGLLATALYSYSVSAISLKRAIFGGAGPLFLTVAIFGPPPAYLRHSTASKGCLLLGLALATYAWSLGFIPK